MNPLSMNITRGKMNKILTLVLYLGKSNNVVPFLQFFHLLHLYMVGSGVASLN